MKKKAHAKTQSQEAKWEQQQRHLLSFYPFVSSLLLGFAPWRLCVSFL
jgi:hypothetical protein